MRKNYYLSGLMMLMLFMLAGCKSYYKVDQFGTRTADHATIAVLPIEMEFTGRMPQDLTEEDLLRLEEAESKAFQISLYNEIQRSTRRGKKSLKVDMQPYNKTLSLLDQHGISLRESWSRDAGELASILGVDAVVRGRIIKARFMSDLASYGIDMGLHLVGMLTNYYSWLLLPPNLTVSKEIIADYRLIDGKEEVDLWAISFDIQADWRSPGKDIIDNISRRASRKFPYR